MFCLFLWCFYQRWNLFRFLVGPRKTSTKKKSKVLNQVKQTLKTWEDLFLVLAYLTICLSLLSKQSWAGLCHIIVHIFSPSITILTQINRHFHRFWVFCDGLYPRFRWSPSCSITSYLKSLNFVDPLISAFHIYGPTHPSQFSLKDDARESISNFSYISSMLTPLVIRKPSMQGIITSLFFSSLNRSSFLRAQHSLPWRECFKDRLQRLFLDFIKI